MLVKTSIIEKEKERKKKRGKEKMKRLYYIELDTVSWGKIQPFENEDMSKVMKEQRRYIEQMEKDGDIRAVYIKMKDVPETTLENGINLNKQIEEAEKEVNKETSSKMKEKETER